MKDWVAPHSPHTSPMDSGNAPAANSQAMNRRLDGAPQRYDATDCDVPLMREEPHWIRMYGTLDGRGVVTERVPIKVSAVNMWGEDGHCLLPLDNQ